jgi:lysophospholipase L1-like esterase
MGGFEPERPPGRTRPSLKGRPDPTRATRQLGPAGRVLVIGLVCFGLWSLLAAPALRRAAEASPLGLRRSAALAVLRPLARMSSWLSLDRIDNAADRALGRTHAPAEGKALPPIPPLDEAITRPTSSGLRPQSEAGELRPSPRAPSDLEQRILPLLPRPSAKHPVRVLVAGDSVASDLGYGLGRLVSGRRFFSIKIDARTSTGLARNDYFNWPYQLALDMRSFKPTVVVLMFGGNDTQGFFVRGRPVLWGTPEWKVQYRRRVASVMNEVTKSGRPLVWVGMPIVSSSGLSGKYRIVNRIYESEASRDDHVAYVDAWKLFSDRRGRYAAFLRGPGGGLERVRTGDGIHMTSAGGDRFASAVFASMKRFWVG